MDRKIDLNVDVIHHITGLSKVGVDPYPHFVDKNLDQKLVAKLTREHKLSKGMRSYDSAEIQDQSLRFTVQLLDGWVLRKCQPNEVPTGGIDLATQPKEGKQYNWCLYLLNQFMEDCRAA